ncbi:MAG: Ldh family oxidoreductase, partial [Chloroflexi bacterium]
MSEILVSAEQLQTFISNLFVSTEMSQEDADFCAEALVKTNLWGIDSHGVLRAPVYLERLRKRAMNPTPKFKKIQGSGAFEVLDGDDGAGFVV